MKKRLIAAALAGMAVNSQAADPSLEDKLKALETQVEQLKAQIKELAAQRQAQSPAGSENEQDRTSLYGYGEFNYNRFHDSDRTSRADLRRFVFGFGHRFNDRLSFNSEVELEHAVSSAEDRGEIEIEQAYLNYKFSDALNVKGGLFLIPLGILNETHEPPTYYGVERNEVETRIIPTTWRELGVGVHGLLGGGFKYDAGVTTGFDSAKLDDPNTGIRSAHQEGQLAEAKDLSAYGALNYVGPGFLFGGGVFTGNTGQNGQSNPLLKGVAAKLTLWDAHAKYRIGGFDLQALYAAGRLGDAERLNAVTSAAATPFAAPKSLKGWYGQAAYHVYRRGDLDVAPFVRLERFEIRQQEDAALGVFQDPNNLERVRTVGVNFKIHPQVVIKSDVQRYSTDRTKDRFNIGLGYMF
jgi:phosphate-selective porin O/P